MHMIHVAVGHRSLKSSAKQIGHTHAAPFEIIALFLLCMHKYQHSDKSLGGDTVFFLPLLPQVQARYGRTVGTIFNEMHNCAANRNFSAENTGKMLRFMGYEEIRQTLHQLFSFLSGSASLGLQQRRFCRHRFASQDLAFQLGVRENSHEFLGAFYGEITHFHLRHIAVIFGEKGLFDRFGSFRKKLINEDLLLGSGFGDGTDIVHADFHHMGSFCFLM